MRTGKRFLSVLMSVVLVVGLMPMPAFAQGSRLVAAGVGAESAEGSACAVLYENGDLVIQNTVEPDGSEGHAEDDVVETYEEIETLAWFDFGDGEGMDAPKWYEQSELITNVSVDGNVVIRDIGDYDTDYFNFDGCENLLSADLSGLDVSRVPMFFDRLFQGCNSLEDVSLSGIDTSNATSMSWMFNQCSALDSVDMSDADTSNVSDMSGMFENCDSLTTLIIGEKTKLLSECGLAEGSWTQEDGDLLFETTDDFIAATGSAEAAGTWTLTRSDDDPDEPVINYPVSGTWGGNLTWQLAEDGCLAISGEGRMADFEYGQDGVAWHSDECREAIKSVVIEPGVTSISRCAFQDCHNLTSVTIPEGVTSIGGDAFYYCGLTSIELPDSLRSVDVGAFFGCSSLESVAVADGDGPYHADAYGALYRETELLYYPEGATAERFEIEDGTTSFGWDWDGEMTNDKLKILSIPDSLRQFEAFRVSLPSLERYEAANGEGSFFADESGALYRSDGDEISMVSYPQGRQAESYSVVNGTKVIGDGAFSMYGATHVKTSAAYQLKSIDLGDSIKAIGQNAFTDCLVLESLEIPASCTSIADDFRGCVSLRSFAVDEENERYLSDECGALYDKIEKRFIRFPIGSDLSEYAVMPGTRTIDSYAFSYMEWDYLAPYDEELGKYVAPNLKHVVVPSTVESIGGGTFEDSQLDGITILSSTVEFDGNPAGNWMDDGTIIRCTSGSTAQAWAEGEGFGVEVVSEPDFQIAGLEEAYDYTGGAIVPDVQVSRGGVVLGEGDYAVLYADNVSGPTATMLVYGKGDYAGLACEASFGVNEPPNLIDISKASVSVPAQVYTGKTLRPSVTVTLAGKTLSADAYTVTYTSNVHVGDAEVRVFGTNDYTGMATGSFKIEPAKAVVSSQDATKVYGEPDPALSATVSGLFGDDSVEYTLSREKGEDAGTYAVTPIGETLQGDYEVAYIASGKLTISPKAAKVTALDTSKTYGDPDPEFSASVDGLVGDDAVEYTLSREPGEDAGEYAITASGEATQGNYAVSFEPATFTIEPAELTITARDCTKALGAADPQFEAVVTGYKFGDESAEGVVAYRFERAAGEAEGEYAVTPVVTSISDNYTARVVSGTLTVVKAYVVVRVPNLTKTYGHRDPDFEVEYIRHGPVDEDFVPVVNLFRALGENVGTYVVRPFGATEQGGYGIVLEEGSLTITPAKATVRAKDITKSYGNSDPQLTADVSGLYGKDSIKYSLTRAVGEGFGSYAITASGETAQGNYEVEFSGGTFTVERRSLEDAALDLSKTDFIYNGKAQKPTVKVAVGGRTLESGTDYTLRYSNSASTKAGTYKVWVEGKGNYAGTSAKAEYAIVMLVNPVKVTAKSPAVKLAKVAKAKQVIAAKNAFSITGNKGGKATYKKASGDKALSVASNGNVTVAKGTKKGPHTVKVKVSIAAKGSYAAFSKTVTLKVTVK